MSNSVQRTIVNRTDASKKHEIHFMSMPEGGSAGKWKSLPAGERSVMEEGDLLVIASDYKTNYQIRNRSGLRLLLRQVNNAHPDYPGQTVVVYKLEEEYTFDSDTSGEVESTGDPDSTEDDQQFTLNSNGDGDFEVFDPEEPEP